jgi:hypothetical protein
MIKKPETHFIREYWWTILCLYGFLVVADSVGNMIVQVWMWGLTGLWNWNYWSFWLPLSLLEMSLCYGGILTAATMLEWFFRRR